MAKNIAAWWSGATTSNPEVQTHRLTMSASNGLWWVGEQASGTTQHMRTHPAPSYMPNLFVLTDHREVPPLWRVTRDEKVW